MRISDIKDYKENRPFAHAVVPNFVTNTDELLKAISTLEFTEKEADLFSFLQSFDLNTTEHKVIQDFITHIKEQIPDFAAVTGVELTDTIDIQATVYRDTDFLLCHDDQLDSRKIAFICYLSDMKEDEGGALRLYYSAQGKVLPDKYKDIIPQAGTLAFFTVSDRSFHEVTEVLVEKDRIALGGWMHGR